MFEPPVKQLQSSLLEVLTNARDHFADVYIDYSNEEGKKVLWAHKAILLARVPPSFREQYMLELLQETEEQRSTNDHAVPSVTELRTLPTVLPYELCNSLLLYWYTGNMISEDVEKKLQAIDKSLNAGLGLSDESTAERKERWRQDLQRLFDEAILTDVEVNTIDIENNSSNTSSNATSHMQLRQTNDSVSVAAHRFILASQSNYFHSTLCTDFNKASNSIIRLPSDIFPSTSLLKLILTYLYTEKIIIPAIPASIISHYPKSQQRLNEKRYELRLLQKALLAADYLCLQESMGRAILLKIAILCHQFRCVCSECAALLPSMFLFFVVKHENYMPRLKDKLLQLYTDPVDSLAPLYSQKPFAILISSLLKGSIITTTEIIHTNNKNKSNLNEDGSYDDVSITIQQPQTINGNKQKLVYELETRTLANITKQNAVRALHSLHLCLSQLRGADPFPTWSQPILNILNRLLHFTVDMVANHFDYYCAEYPVLLSCVDGIGFGFSVDFLGFVLSHVLKEGMHDKNAAVIYQGIVRDLGGRQEMIKNVAVEGVLLEARSKCVQYLSKHWTNVKAEGGFKNIDREILKRLAEDIDVSFRSLTKPLDNDFSSIFSFKPKKLLSGNTDNSNLNKSSLNNYSPKDDTYLSSSTLHSNDMPRSSSPSLKRLSLGAIPSTVDAVSSNDDLATAAARARSLSASTALTPEESSILRNETKSNKECKAASSSQTTAALGHAPRFIDPQNKIRQSSVGSLTDALLPLDINSSTSTSSDGAGEKASRPTKLRFALPDTPSRVKASQYGASSQLRDKSRKKKKRAKSPSSNSRWSLVGGYGSSTTSDSSDDEANDINPAVGQKVELLRRPLPTLGTIKYIGPVDFAKGTWVGVELESRLGNNDGSVEGKRYFQTFPQRGVFVKIDDFKILSNYHRTADKK